MFLIIQIILFFLLNPLSSFANGIECNMLKGLEKLEEMKMSLNRKTKNPNYKKILDILGKEEQILYLKLDELLGDISSSRAKDINKYIESSRLIQNDAVKLLDRPEVIYHNPGHHDPNSPNFRGGGSKTSLIPHNHKKLFDDAVPHINPENNKVSYWICSANGVWHRFQGGLEGGFLKLHWNGTSVGARKLKKREIPNSLQNYFKLLNKKCKM